MNDIEPIAVVLKFGFIAVLYLFLLWMGRTALRDLRGTAAGGIEHTGYHDVVAEEPSSDQAWLVVQEGGGLKQGERYDLFGGLTIGRSPDADLRIDDRYSSSVHARIFGRGGEWWAEDLQSTNGTLLNSAELHGEAQIDEGDLIRIGDTEFRFERGGH